MISVNDTLERPKTAPTYRVRTDAMAAAVFTLGPQARHGFEYTTMKCDGRWVWKPTDEVRPPTPAEIKANGGKRSLIQPEEATAVAASGSTIKPVPLSPAAEQLGRMGFTDVAQNPSDGLAIPEFLKRESTPEALEEVTKAMKRIAKQVGPGRTIKNPPDMKAAVKRSEKAKAAFAKFEGTPEHAKAQKAIKIEDLHKTPAGKANAKSWEAIAAVRKAAAKAEKARTNVDEPTDISWSELTGEDLRPANPKSQTVGPEAMDAIKRMGNPAGARRKAKEKLFSEGGWATKKTAKRASKPAPKVAVPSKGQSKTAMVGEMLLRPNGCTAAEVMAACNWPSVSMPQQAKAAGLTLRKEKVAGEPTRYYGSR